MQYSVLIFSNFWKNWIVKWTPLDYLNLVFINIFAEHTFNSIMWQGLVYWGLNRFSKWVWESGVSWSIWDGGCYKKCGRDPIKLLLLLLLLLNTELFVEASNFFQTKEKINRSSILHLLLTRLEKVLKINFEDIIIPIIQLFLYFYNQVLYL